MKQLSYSIKTLDELKKALEEIQEKNYYKEAKSVLIQIYELKCDITYINEMITCVREKVPKAIISGTTSSGEICNGEIKRHCSVITVSFFMESNVMIREFDCNKIDEKNAGIQLSSLLNNTEDISGVQILSTSSAVNLTKFIHEIKIDDQDDYPLFGAGAGDYGSVVSRNTMIFGNKVLKNGIIAVIFTGENLHIKVDYCLGWVPLGKEMEITETEGELCITKIDGVPATSVYQKYLNVPPNKNFINNTCEFPITMVRDNQLITRVPYKSDNEGRIYFTADVHKGEKIRLSFGNPKYILEATEQLSRRMKSFNSQVLFIYACVNRIILLGQKAKNEIDFFKDTAESINGFYGHSEIIKNGKRGFVFNTAMIAVGMREGEGNNISIRDNRLKDNFKDNDGKVPFIDRLLTFLEATSDELKESNEKLQKMVITDSLTEIYNRRKIEEIFDYEISKRCENGLMSIIMFDIDDFKLINDTFGHDCGDNVLRIVAKTLKNNSRCCDSIGRWGGEEFMMILPNTSCETAIKVAERMRKSVDSLYIDKVENVTVSVGIATVMSKENKNEVYRRVDKALYNAKANGKNRIEIS